MGAMRIVRSVVIDCHIEDVFGYVADPLKDPTWRPTVLAVDQIAGNGPGPGARYEMLQRPSSWRPPRPTVCTCVDWDPPDRIAWRCEAAGDAIDVSYALEPAWTSTRLTWRQEHWLRAARILHPALKLAAARDVQHQLGALRRRLEQG
jgi:uncharacterized protein YndB with AHSA1/START domain